MGVLLYVTDAVRLVRKNLDELDPAGPIQYGTEGSDNESLDALIEQNLPEAINAVNLAAPVTLLDGVYEIDGNDLEILESPVVDKVLKFRITATDYLRLVALKMKDSPLVVTDVIPEASPEGHKQLNPYIRGRSDRPRLVRRQGANTEGPEFCYYSLSSSPEAGEEKDCIDYLQILKEVKYNKNTPAQSYQVSQRLRQRIIDLLTATVLETYGDQRAQAFIQKAINW